MFGFKFGKKKAKLEYMKSSEDAERKKAEVVELDKDGNPVNPEEAEKKELGPLTQEEIDEAIKNLEKVYNLPEYKRKRFVEKLKHRLKKIRDVAITVGGSVLTVAPVVLMGLAFKGDLDPNIFQFVKDLPIYLTAGGVTLAYGLPSLERRRQEAKGIRSVEYTYEGSKQKLEYLKDKVAFLNERIARGEKVEESKKELEEIKQYVESLKARVKEKLQERYGEVDEGENE